MGIKVSLWGIQSMILVTALYGPDGSITYKPVELVCCTPETNVILCVNYTEEIFKNSHCRSSRI